VTWKVVLSVQIMAGWRVATMVEEWVEQMEGLLGCKMDSLMVVGTVEL